MNRRRVAVFHERPLPQIQIPFTCPPLPTLLPESSERAHSPSTPPFSSPFHRVCGGPTLPEQRHSQALQLVWPVLPSSISFSQPLNPCLQAWDPPMLLFHSSNPSHPSPFRCCDTTPPNTTSLQAGWKSLGQAIRQTKAGHPTKDGGKVAEQNR